jgi:two-component system, sensor histidine kinase and response regulator
MLRTINSTNSDLNCLHNDLGQNFLFVDNVSELKRLKPEIELCIIQTDFNKIDLKFIKKIKKVNKNTEFWICSNNLSRDNILIANKAGIKTVISSPIDKKMVEDFFKAKKGLCINEKSDTNYDYTSILNSKVMIVDDNNMNVELLEEILAKFNLEISSFVKPQEAFQVILHEKFDLILLDIMMPEMSGFDLAEKIKATPHNKNVPIIFISALSDSHNKIKGYDLGSYAYIEKPFDVNVIRAQIFNLLKSRKDQDRLNSNKEDFLATVAHDLKTPISAGINALNLLLNENLGELEENQHELVEDILNSTKFMQDMVENLLCKSKIENNKVTLSKQVCPLKKVVEHCIDLTKYILIPKKQRVQLECKIENTLLPIDFLEIKRAIHNLIANASEYSPEGSKILIRIFETGNKIGVDVQDFGKGIDLINQEDVFSQYMSFAKKYKRVGSGLGLYITKRIVEAHGGEITLESKIGCGTTITIMLPNYVKE